MAPPPFDGPRPLVLVVEDDPNTAAAIVDAIGEAGYRTAWARDGREALMALEAEEPTFMLVDMSMPGMNGPELLAEMRRSSRWSHIPRVIMTGANDAAIGIREDLIVLYKPLDLDALLNVVRRNCDGHWAPAVPSANMHRRSS
jgi:CheY-like chemotaxis protein